MAYVPRYAGSQPALEEIGDWSGETLLEFGTDWCGHCTLAQPLVEAAVTRWPGLRHVKVEDGRGRRLGRAFRIKLWPTLVLLREGVEVARVVRPRADGDMDAFFEGDGGAGAGRGTR